MPKGSKIALVNPKRSKNVDFPTQGGEDDRKTTLRRGRIPNSVLREKDGKRLATARRRRPYRAWAMKRFYRDFEHA